MLIKSFGEFWNADTVEWTARRLVGEIKYTSSSGNQTRPHINFWEAKGIYVLYSDFKAVYVGKALGETSSIGSRLKAHLTDRLQARWDMFSWYSINNPKISDKTVQTAGIRQVNQATVVDTLEALSILITDPVLNRRHERIRDAYEAIQVGGSIRSIRSYLEEIVKNTDPARP